MTVKVIGTCSVCSGRVAVPSVWMGIYPPIPECIDCRAKAASHGPVIPMKPAPERIANRNNPVLKALVGLALETFVKQ